VDTAYAWVDTRRHSLYQTLDFRVIEDTLEFVFFEKPM